MVEGEIYNLHFFLGRLLTETFCRENSHYLWLKEKRLPKSMAKYWCLLHFVQCAEKINIAGKRTSFGNCVTANENWIICNELTNKRKMIITTNCGDLQNITIQCKCINNTRDNRSIYLLTAHRYKAKKSNCRFERAPIKHGRSSIS